MKKPGKKPVMVSLFPLNPEQALRAFMQVDPRRIKEKERQAQARRKAKKKRTAK